jgi:protein-tyrosine kinase
MEKIQVAVERARAQRAAQGTIRTSESNRLDELLKRSAGQPLIDETLVGKLAESSKDWWSQKVLTQFGKRPFTRRDQKLGFESFRLLRTRLQNTSADGKRKVHLFAITSPQQGDGKSVVAVNLALSFSMQRGQKVLLIDADMRLPSIQEMLNIQVDYGLSDFLDGGVPLEKCTVMVNETQLFVVPQITKSARSSEILSNGMLGKLTTLVRNQYPDWLVVVDCPPILPVDDTLIIVENVDKAALVVREGKTTLEEFRRGVNAINPDKYLGAIVNASRSRSALSRSYVYG